MDSAPKLWNRNFTILTLGTVVSMVGGLLVDFAMALEILDLTESTFLFSLFMVSFTAPKVIVPVIAGPFVDRFSRRKMIYTLDFIMGGLFLAATGFIYLDLMNYGIYLVFSIITSCIYSVYQVAYESFYPLLVDKGNFSKAYSVSSTLECVVMVVTPLSAFLYNLIGLAPIFFINAASYLIAAAMETQIKVEENYVKKEEESFSFKKYIEDFKYGVEYIKSEKGLGAITTYFTISAFAYASFDVVVLPYFRASYENGEYIFMLVMGAGVVGRIIAGGFHYKLKIPAARKYLVAVIVYCATNILQGTLIFMPVVVMIIMNFIDGCLGMTSYNIRIASTQSYVPDDRKGRFNGSFNMFTTAGSLLGQLVAGIMGDYLDMRFVIAIFMTLGLITVFLTIVRRRKEVKLIYNQNV